MAVNVLTIMPTLINTPCITHKKHGEHNESKEQYTAKRKRNARFDSQHDQRRVSSPKGPEGL